MVLVPALAPVAHAQFSHAQLSPLSQLPETGGHEAGYHSMDHVARLAAGDEGDVCVMFDLLASKEPGSLAMCKDLFGECRLHLNVGRARDEDEILKRLRAADCTSANLETSRYDSQTGKPHSLPFSPPTSFLPSVCSRPCAPVRVCPPPRVSTFLSSLHM